MLEGNNIVTGRMAVKQVVKCRFHDKEARYELAYYPDEGMVIYRCLLCHKGEFLMRLEIPKGEANAKRSVSPQKVV